MPQSSSPIRSITLAAFILASAPVVLAQRGGSGRGAGANQTHGPRPISEVIHADAQHQTGIFEVYLQKDAATDAQHVLFAIPADQLDRDFLWVSLIAKTPFGAGYGGDQADQYVVRWERHDDTILLRRADYRMVADPSLPIAGAVAASDNSAIIMAFPVEAWGNNHEAVIDATKLFDTEVPEFSPRQRLGARGFDASRSYLDGVRAFPENIEVTATQTYTTPLPEPGAGRGGAPAGRGGRGAPYLGPSATVEMHYSMIQLPKVPMKPRLFDDRVGYFTVSQQDFGRNEERAPVRTYITRWRLEKKDPSAAVSDPVKPLVYYIDPNTPAQWRPWVRKGIEDWQPAFEAAGFSHAIIAKDAPTAAEDPYWSPQDMRHSMIRWLPSTIENSVGPNIHDPRSGEILNAQVQIYQNVLQLATQWYFVQVGPDDPRAAHLPLPEDLAGRLLEYVVAHEVGHTLGFQHNMKSSAMYDARKMRDAAFLHQMGDVATLMDYARFDYVAQPEDHVAPEDLIPRIGPYDKWAVHWGYAPIAGADTPDAEKATLDSWSREQDKTPWLRFSTANSDGADPEENTEAVGDQDAIFSTGMGLRNLHRVMDMLVPATTWEPGHRYTRTADVYARLLGQWVLEMNHVAVIVGGVDSQDKHTGQTGPQFTPESKARQSAAVAFLNANAFATPKFLVQPAITRRFEPDGSLDLLRNSQTAVLNRLFQDARLERLIELRAEDGAAAYSPSQFMDDVRGGVWTELGGAMVTIDAYRRNLQDSYIDLLGRKLAETTPGMHEPQALVRADLIALNGEIHRALPKTHDAATRAHLVASIDAIDKALDPKFAPAAPAAAGPFARGVSQDDGLFCWPDVRVTRDGVSGLGGGGK